MPITHTHTEEMSVRSIFSLFEFYSYFAICDTTKAAFNVLGFFLPTLDQKQYSRHQLTDIPTKFPLFSYVLETLLLNKIQCWRTSQC